MLVSRRLANKQTGCLVLQKTKNKQKKTKKLKTKKLKNKNTTKQTNKTNKQNKQTNVLAFHNSVCFVMFQAQDKETQPCWWIWVKKRGIQRR